MRKASPPGSFVRLAAIRALALRETEAALKKMPKVSGGGAGQVYLAPEMARVFETAQKMSEKAGDSYVSAERLLQALAIEPSEAANILKSAGVTPQGLNQAINDIRKGRTADFSFRRTRSMMRSRNMRAI